MNEDYTFARIPLKYAQVKFDLIPDELSCKAKIKKYLDNFITYYNSGLGLYLFSEMPSTGKTAIAVMVLRYALRLYKLGLFVTSNELVSSVMNKTTFDETTTLFERAKQVNVLVIDDFGGEYRTDSGFVVNLLEDLIRYRTNEMKPTIFTSNTVAPANIAKVYSPALGALMTESTMVVGVYGIDWRAKRKQELKNELEV